MIKIELLPFTSKWVESFKQEKRVLYALIGKEVAIEHIGSTAVPGLMAKPTIDILIGVHEFNDRSFFISEITSLDYHYIPEYEFNLPERKYFEKIQNGHHIAHIHLVQKGGEFGKNIFSFEISYNQTKNYVIIIVNLNKTYLTRNGKIETTMRQLKLRLLNKWKISIMNKPFNNYLIILSISQ